jgi:hypothetical protein
MKFKAGDRVYYNGNGEDYNAPTSAGEAIINEPDDWKPTQRPDSQFYSCQFLDDEWFLAEEDLRRLDQTETTPEFWVTVNGKLKFGGYDTHEEASGVAYEMALENGNACVLQIVDRYERTVSVARFPL